MWYTINTYVVYYIANVNSSEILILLNSSLKTSFVVVTHDLELADKLGKIAYLDDGKLAIKESHYVA